MRATLAMLSILIAAPATASPCLVSIPGARCVSVPAEGAEETSVEDATADEGISARFVSARTSSDTPRQRRTGSFRKVEVTPPRFEAGDVLPDDVMILMNRERFGLPAPQDGWTYFRDGYDVYRADLRTREVLDRMNDHMSIRF